MKGIFLIFILMVLFTTSCSKELPENTIFSIPDEFDISMHQTPTLQGTQPSFLITTKSHFPCSNANLEVQLVSFDDNVKINITDIVENSDCNYRPGILEKELFAFLTPGRYGLEIALKDAITNRGILVISDKKFSFDMENTYGFDIINSEVKKIPHHYLWGVVKAKNIEDILLVDELRKNIQPYTIVSKDLSPGNYGIFTITETNTIIFKDSPINNLTEVFLYKLNEDVGAEVSKIIKSFQENHPEIEIKAASTQEQIL